MKNNSGLNEFSHQLLVGGKRTDIILAKPVYDFKELKKLYPAIKKDDSVWYEFVKAAVTKQTGIKITKVN